MTKVSNDYFEAYGYTAENHDKKITDVSNKAYAPKSSNGQTNTGPPPVTVMDVAYLEHTAVWFK